MLSNIQIYNGGKLLYILCGLPLVILNETTV